MHPLLVYKQPASKNLSDAMTITPQEAFYIIKNSVENSMGGIEFDEDEIEPLIRLKKVRNAIEHFIYDLSPEEIKEDIVGGINNQVQHPTGKVPRWASTTNN